MAKGERAVATERAFYAANTTREVVPGHVTLIPWLEWIDQRRQRVCEVCKWV